MWKHRYVYTHRKYVMCVQEMCDMCTGSVWCVYRKCLCVQEVFVMCTGNVWYVYRKCLVCVQEMFVLCTGSVCYVYRKCLVCVQEVFVMCTGSVCYVYRKCLLYVQEHHHRWGLGRTDQNSQPWRDWHWWRQWWWWTCGRWVWVWQAHHVWYFLMHQQVNCWERGLVKASTSKVHPLGHSSTQVSPDWKRVQG